LHSKRFHPQIVTAIAVVRGQPPFNYNLPKNTPFRKREKEKDRQKREEGRWKL